MTTIAQALNDLHEERTNLNLANEGKVSTINALIPPDVAARIADIEAQYADYESKCLERIAELEAEIKSAVLEAGATVRGQFLMAVYVNGRVSWDDKALNGYMVDHPELARFRNVSKPSVTIRKAS